MATKAALSAATALCLSIGATAARAQTAAPAPAPAAAPAAPATVTLPTPGMAGPLAFQATPFSLDVGPLGKWYVDGVLSGFALGQSNPLPADNGGRADLSNGQVILQKIDGVLQFYAQLGAYSVPVIGTQYTNLLDSGAAENDLYGYVPQAFVKIVPTDNFSIMAGKLPTLIGAESTFTFQNMNVMRGLLWNQENAVSRGVQANYTTGPVSVSVSLNDGYYSDRYTWLTGLVSWTISPTSTLVVDAGGNLGSNAKNTVATPLAQNNSIIGNLIYTYNAAPLVITPYLQFSHVDANAKIGLKKSADTWSGAVLATYTFNENYSLGGRAEFIASSGDQGDPDATNLLYGPGSKAVSFTVTPTYKINQFFVRGDLSWVGILDGTSGFGFGKEFNKSNQFRAAIEAGVIF